MKKIIQTASLAFSLLFCADGLTNQVSTAKPLADSLVWKITGPGLAEPSYLAGTLHMMCQSDFTFDPRFKRAIELTNRLYLELDFDDVNDMALLEKAMFTDIPLKDRLSTNQYQQLAKYLKNHSNLRIDQLEHMSFMAIQTTLLLSHLSCPVKSVDLELTQQAKQSGQEIYGLETAAEQIKITEVFIPPIEEHPWTTEELSYYLGDNNSFNEMLNLYQKQDITALYQLITNHMNVLENSAQIKAVILDDRNQKWVEKMPAIMQSSATFFAVGSGHLAGEQGVINLLRLAGYTVQPVME
jgi:uncharacterized protein YbaP (TraB family)